jgi:hypothetical protein
MRDKTTLFKCALQRRDKTTVFKDTPRGKTQPLCLNVPLEEIKPLCLKVPLEERHNHSV